MKTIKKMGLRFITVLLPVFMKFAKDKISPFIQEWSAEFKKLPKKLQYAFLGTFFLGIVFTIALQLIFSKSQEGPLILGSENGDRIAPVSVAFAERREVRNVFSTFAHLRPAKEVTLHPPQHVSVRDLFISLGMHVEKGQPLVKLDSELQLLKSQLDVIDTQVKEMDFGVTLSLAKQNFLSKNEFQQKQLDLRAAKIRKRIQELESSAELIAPISGIISEISLKIGDFIDNVQNYFIKIVDNKNHRIELYLPQNVASKLILGSEVVLQRSAASSKATLSAVAPLVDPKTGSVFSEITANEIPPGWISGMYVEVQVPIDIAKDSLSVPTEAIVYENNKSFLYRIIPAGPADSGPAEDKITSRTPASLPAASQRSQDQVEKVEVKLGISDSKYVVIEEGIEELDQVVIQGQGGLRDGSAVEILD